MHTTIDNLNHNPSSFRDPSGFIFTYNSRIYRTVDASYESTYVQLMKSGLYDRLIQESLLIPHKEVRPPKNVKNVKVVLEPEKIPFISYPYEWCFSQLKDAALLTLAIQKIALEYGMTLRDASSYNVQQYHGKAIFIDTLSFGIYTEGRPWVAYKQFCEQFLAPLALIAYVEPRLSRLSRSFLNGVPLDLAIKLLPWRKKIQKELLLHLVLHAHTIQSVDKPDTDKSKFFFSKSSMMGLISSLESAVRSITWNPTKTLWSDYVRNNTAVSYTPLSMEDKRRKVEYCINLCHSKYIWDLGANIGEFSRIASQLGAFVVSIDSDPSVIELQYLNNRSQNIRTILPLCIDVLNPTPNLGWMNTERESFYNRPRPDTILALALIHHLAIGENIPLSNLTKAFASLCEKLIIEFVPKSDQQVQDMLRFRKDIFSSYTQAEFETEFTKYFSVAFSKKISASDRWIYVFKKKT